MESAHDTEFEIPCPSHLSYLHSVHHSSTISFIVQAYLCTCTVYFSSVSFWFNCHYYGSKTVTQSVLKSFAFFSGKDIEIALTELRELQNHIDTLMVKDKKSKSEIQELLETKYRLEKWVSECLCTFMLLAVVNLHNLHFINFIKLNRTLILESIQGERLKVKTIFNRGM